MPACSGASAMNVLLWSMSGSCSTRFAGRRRRGDLDEHAATATRRSRDSPDPRRCTNPRPCVAVADRTRIPPDHPRPRTLRAGSAELSGTQHLVALTVPWDGEPQDVSAKLHTRNYVRVKGRERGRGHAGRMRSTARRAGGGCGENSRSEGARGVRDLVGRAPSRMRSAPKEPSCQPRTKTPATIRWFRRSSVRHMGDPTKTSLCIARGTTL